LTLPNKIGFFFHILVPLHRYHELVRYPKLSFWRDRVA
jgi:hypothetical protein